MYLDGFDELVGVQEIEKPDEIREKNDKTDCEQDDTDEERRPRHVGDGEGGVDEDDVDAGGRDKGEDSCHQRTLEKDADDHRGEPRHSELHDKHRGGKHGEQDRHHVLAEGAEGPKTLVGFGAEQGGEELGHLIPARSGGIKEKDSLRSVLREKFRD